MMTKIADNTVEAHHSAVNECCDMSISVAT